MSKRWVRIVAEYPAGGASITDAETGQILHGVTNVTLEMPAGGPFVAKLDVLAEIDTVVEGEIKRWRLDEDTGKYEELTKDAAANEPIRSTVAHNGNVYVENRAESLRTGWVTYRDEPACRVDMETGEVIPDRPEHLRIREFPAWEAAMDDGRGLPPGVDDDEGSE